MAKKEPERFTDAWYKYWADKAMETADEPKKKRKLVRCIKCVNCQFGKIGEFECVEHVHGKTESNWDEHNLTRKVVVAKRYCENYIEAK